MPPVAWVCPADAAQVRMLHQWCVKFRLQLVPAGVCQGLHDPFEAEPLRPVDLYSRVDPAVPTICIDVRRHLTQSGSDQNGGLWRAGPGCTIGDLPAAVADDLLSHPDVHAGQTLASWFARSGRSRYLSAVDVMLPDGSLERFGRLGAQGGASLRSPTAKRLIAALFQMLCEPRAQTWCTSQDWPSRYRLDAIRVDHRRVPDMARLLAGSRGTLVWVEQLIFDLGHPVGMAENARQSGFDLEAVALERRIKALFDPANILPRLPGLVGSDDA